MDEYVDKTDKEGKEELEDIKAEDVVLENDICKLGVVQRLVDSY